MSEFWLRRGTAVSLFVVLSLGAALRLYGLDVQSLWNDELSAWRRSNYDTLAEVMARGIPPDHPPGYQIFLYYWMRLVGDSEMALRLPSALAGIAAISAIFLLGRKLYSAKEGVIAAAFTAVLWAPLYYSQEARANMIVMLLVILSIYWLIDIWQAIRQGEKMPVTAVVGYLLTTVTMAYLHYFGLFFVLLQATFMALYFWRQPKTWWRLCLLYGAILLAYLPWITQATHTLAAGSSNWTSKPGTFINSLWRFALFLFSRETMITRVVLILGTAILAQGIWLLWRRPEMRRAYFVSPGTLLLIWLFVPFILVYLRTYWGEGVWVDRNLVNMLPAAYLLLARVITQLPYPRVLVPAVTLSLLALFVFQLIWVESYYTQPKKQQFREAVAAIVAHEEEHPGAPIIGWVWNRATLDYYFIKQGSPRRVDFLLGQADHIDRARAVIADAESPYVWFITAHRAPAPEFMAFLEGEMDTVWHQSFIQADVWLLMKVDMER